MRNKKILTLVFVVAFLTLLVGCFPEPPITENQAPIITSIPGGTAVVGVKYTYTVKATDPEEDNITYSLVSGPTGMGFDGIATISWTPDEGQVGVYGVTVKASDGKKDTLQSFPITVGAVELKLIGIKVFPKAMTLFVGESKPITSVTAHYSNGSTTPIALGFCTYASSATNIATVSNGKITAIAKGTAAITVSYGGKIDTLKVTVSKPPVTPSNDANLSALAVSPGILVPNFSATITEYEVNVAHDVATISVTATLADTKASMTIDGAAQASGTVKTITLIGTTTKINIKITAEDGTTTKTYTITVNWVANLSGLAVDKGELNPEFESNTLAYEVEVDNDVEKIKVTAKTTLESATITITYDYEYTKKGVVTEEFDLLVGGKNIITIIVERDGYLTTTYTITVTRTSLPVDNVSIDKRYATIQDAIDEAGDGNTIIVAVGVYTEYLHITTDGLTIEGAGIDQSIIDLDGLKPYWHYPCSGSYASRAGVLISGYDNPDEIVENITFRGFTVENAGLNPPDGGSYPEFYDDDGDGQDDVRGIVVANGKNISIEYCKVQNSGYNGIGVGAALCTTLKQSEGVTIDNCICVDNWETGISVGNYVGAITITDNICSNNKRPHPDPSSGREYSGKGIEVSGKDDSYPISGLISGNICEDNGFEGIVLKKYADGVTIEDNTVTGHNIDDDGAGIFFYGNKSNPANCMNNVIRNNTVTGNIRGIVAYYAQECTIEDNTITTDAGTFASGQAAIKIDGGNNITVQNNTISCDGVGIKVQKTWNYVDCYDNTFIGNTITGAKFAGVFISHGAHDNTFTGNTITDTAILTRWAGELYEETQGDGIFLWGYPGKEAGADNVFHYNNIYGNADNGMENQITTTIDAENNWWGSGGAGDYAGKPGEGGNNDVSTNVDYVPWLTSEF